MRISRGRRDLDVPPCCKQLRKRHAQETGNCCGLMLWYAMLTYLWQRLYIDPAHHDQQCLIVSARMISHVLAMSLGRRQQFDASNWMINNPTHMIFDYFGCRLCPNIRYMNISWIVSNLGPTRPASLLLRWPGNPNQSAWRREDACESKLTKGRVELAWHHITVAEMQMFYKSLGILREQLYYRSDSCRIGWRGPDLFVRWRWVRPGAARQANGGPHQDDGLICSSPNGPLAWTWWKWQSTCKTVTCLILCVIRFGMLWASAS